MEIKVSNKRELIDALTSVIQNTPDEFFDFDTVVIDVGDEYVVDGDPKKEYHPGAVVKLIGDGIIKVTIPLTRRPEVYAYYSARMDDDIEDRREAIREMEKLKDLFRALGRSEVNGKPSEEND